MDFIEDISVSVDVKSREIYLFGNHENEIDHKVAFLFLQHLCKLEQTAEYIIIHGNTVGGTYYDGLCIYDAVKNSPNHITYVIHGQAMSMGSIIPQAADLRIMMPNAIMMIHRPTLGVDETLTSKQAEESLILGKYNTSRMLNMYAERCQDGEYFRNLGYSFSKVKNFIRRKIDNKHDWWLHPEEAVEYGFVNEVLGKKYKTLKELRSEK